MIDKHDLCVLKYVAKPLKKTVASESNKKPRNNLIEIVLFIVDSRYSKHMTGNLKLLINFVEKFLGTVKFGNDQIAPILGYGDLVQGAVTIKRVYYVEGLNHNLFSVETIADLLGYILESDLEEDPADYPVDGGDDDDDDGSFDDDEDDDDDVQKDEDEEEEEHTALANFI
nr:integrase, catalytic region, zinc finger, CCHC-type, peptidase aspartic, catalytic [Tanacetum cinerariifolium]